MVARAGDPVSRSHWQDQAVSIQGEEVEGVCKWTGQWARHEC